jgi:uncharacterized protein (DUF433 family)
LALATPRGSIACARILATRFNQIVMKIQQIIERQGIVHCDPEIMSGVPVFVGTGVALQTFFDYLEGESGLAEFIEDFPYLKTPALLVLKP